MVLFVIFCGRFGPVFSVSADLNLGQRDRFYLEMCFANSEQIQCGLYPDALSLLMN